VGYRDDGSMWGDGSTAVDDDEVTLDLPFDLSFDDLPIISVALGILAALIPWWTGITLIYVMSTDYWLFVLAGVFFVGGSVLNLRNPVGMVGQAIGIVLFSIQMLAFYSNDTGPFSPYIEDTGMQLGVLFAVASVVICLIGRLFGVYDDRGIDQ